jgi:hypothetical protein
MIHLGDVGTRIDVTCEDNGAPITMQGSDSVDFKFKKPDGTIVTKVGAVLSPPSAIVRYTTVTNDINQSGRWELQLHLNLASQNWEGHSQKTRFDVFSTL